MDTTLAAVQYYAREKYWHHIIIICNDELRKGPDSSLTFWRAFGIFNEGATTEAIRELESIQFRREIQFAAVIALIYYHKQCRLVDHEAIMRFKAQKDQVLQSAPDTAILSACQFLSLIGKNQKAQYLLESVIGANRNNLYALTIAGWNCLLAEEPQKAQAQEFFSRVESEAKELIYSTYLDALLGLAKLHELSKNFKANIEVLNDILVKTNNFVPALIEKAKVLMMIGDWDQILEMVQRILLVSPGNIEALRIWIFYLLSREANHEVATEKLTELSQNIAQKEPKNPDLILSIVRPIARICGRNESILRATLSLVQQARRIRPESAEILTEVGEQLRLLGDFAPAIQTFTEATKKDEANLLPMYKIVRCKIAQGDYGDAAAQLEFLAEIEESSGQTAELTFLQSMIAWRFNQDKKEALSMLDKALSLHVAASKRLNPGYEFYTQLNPDFLLEMAKEYLQYIGLNPLPKTGKPPHYLIRGTKLLETLTKQIPGIIEAQLLLAKAKFVVNETAAAQKHISICLQMDPNFIDALILSSLISLQGNQYLAASAALEQALARNFMIRENPMFMLVKGKIEMKQKKYADALKTFEAAFNLPGVKDGVQQHGNKSALFLNLSIDDRASIFTNLALAYAEMEKMPQATQTIQMAIGEFVGTSAEVQVLISNSELALKKNDLKQAINILNGITYDSPHFKQAKVAQAEIYLTHMTNRRLYAKCYNDIVQQDDSVENYLLLGEALMRIQEPEEAIRIYEKALQHKPDDLFLTREIGRALVLTHDYQRAIRYYESAMRRETHRQELITDLANLYLRLKDYQAASMVLQEALRNVEINDLNSAARAAKNYLLLAKVILGTRRDEDPLNLQPIPDAETALQNARTLQKNLLSQSRELAPDQLNQHKETAASILFMLGEYTETREKDLQKAQNYYSEALSFDEMHTKSLIALARLNIRRNDLQRCMQYCSMMLRIDPSNEEASSMMAELLLQQNQVDRAIACYQQLLDNKPDNYRILANLILLLRRAGKLEDCDVYLKNAEKVAGRHADAGLAYCKGLSLRYQGKAMEAQEEFNKARNDSIYGVLSLQMMIDIYLNPDNEPMWTQNKVSPQNLNFAEQLLDELKTKNYTMMAVVLECMIDIARGHGAGIDQALDKLSNIINNNRNFVPAYIAFSTAKIVQSKNNEAKNQLKHLIGSIPYQGEYAQEFERGWLMLANLYLQENNEQQAGEVLETCLHHNQSCGKAKELLGLIKERQDAINEACKYYEEAWKIDKNATLGYRLAFNYFKGKKFVNAVNICKELLKRYPDYPRVREDILEKARAMLRP